MATPTEPELDRRLRHAALRAVDEAQRSVDVEDDLARLHNRLGGIEPVFARRPGWRGWPARSWIAAAAAVSVVVVAGIAVLAMKQDDDRLAITGGDTSAVSIASTVAVAPVPESTAAATGDATSTTRVTTTTVAGDGGALARATPEPAVAAPLQLVTITPSEPVSLCFSGQFPLGIVEAGHLRLLGVVTHDGYLLSDETSAGGCDGGQPWDESLDVRLPAPLDPGDYVICLSDIDDAAGCAPVTVKTWADACFRSPIAPPGLVDGSDPGEPSPDAVDPSVATWGAGRVAISQVVGARPDQTWIAMPIRRSGSYEMFTGVEPGATVLSITGGPDFCPRRYLLAPELQLDPVWALAGRWLAFFTDGVPVPTDRHPELLAPSEYFGVRYYTVGMEGGSAIHRFAADGTDLGEVDDAELIPAAPGVELDDGRRIRFDPATQHGEACQNRPLLIGGESAERPLHPDLDAARSFASTPTGVVVATRHICPEGDTGAVTFQTVLVDLGDPDGSVSVLVEDVVAPGALGGRIVRWISPDGRLIGLSEMVSGEASRGTVVAVADPTAELEVPSGCAAATDVVSQPVFVGDSLFIARACPNGERVFVTIDQLTLGDLSLVWSADVEREILAYCNCASISVGPGPTPSVIATGSPSVEQPNTSILLVGDQQTDISHLGFDRLAFTIAELLPQSP